MRPREACRVTLNTSKRSITSVRFSGFYYKQQYKRTLWQRYGDERVIRDDEATIEVARYILANPLRAGLVTDVREYRFTGSSVVTIDELIEHLRMMQVRLKPDSTINRTHDRCADLLFVQQVTSASLDSCG